MSVDQVVDRAPAGAPEKSSAVADEATVVGATAVEPNWSSWSNLWQVPSILIATGLIALGLYTGVRPTLPNDFDGALDQVEEFNRVGQYDLAAGQLKRVIEPHLAQATPLQQARFHAALADYFAARRDALLQDRSDATDINHRINDHYAKAVELELALSPRRLERWAETLLAMNDVAEAGKRIDELEALAARVSEDATIAFEATAARHRMFRALVETLASRPESPFDQVMIMLADYRLNHGISAEGEIWAIARQTELRMRFAAGDAAATRQAIDLLLVEMRRLENRDLHERGPRIAELYTYLGAGYFELGEYDKAQHHLNHALALFAGPEAARGYALTLLGQIEMSKGDADSALDHFQIVVRDFIATPSYLNGLLGRAEAHSILGSHEESLADFRELCGQLVKHGGTADMSVLRAAETLCDRGDASVALAKLDMALSYLALAEGLFTAEDVPAMVLVRLASVHRHLADTIIADARGESAAPALLDPAVRYEANSHYERAGDYYLRHANASKSSERAVEESSGSLWLAADSFDLGGRQDMAIKYFTRYLEMHAIDDARRPSTLFRMAQAHHAILDFENAAVTYERVVANHARSEFGTRSFVPLARCYLELNRLSDARQILRQVLGGGRAPVLINPDAADFRDALLELGRIEYQGNFHTAAIEALAEFLHRYPGDERALEVRYLLADCYRASAQLIAQRLKQDNGSAPTESGRLTALSAEHWQMAQDLFAQVVSHGHSKPSPKLGAAPDDLVRRAALYQADCAFALGRLEQAVALYDHAARQYSGHHSSMYALIQIVNSYTALGDMERAAAAHHRALVRLKQLPDDTFATPDALMDRTAWERWLESNPVAPARTASASGAGG